MLKQYYSHFIVVIIGLISGFSIQMNWLANASLYRNFSLTYVVSLLVITAVMMALVLLTAHVLTLRKSYRNHPAYHSNSLATWDACAYLPMLLVAVGIWGVNVTPIFFAGIVITMIIIKQVGIIKITGSQKIIGIKSILGILFMISGFAALIYQITWQRVLFATFGINIESVTLIISIFMFGLGIGSLIGGYLSERLPNYLPHLFFICELAIGAFGLMSIYMIKHMSDVVILGDFIHIALSIFVLLCFPTAMMGATLPILVTYINKAHNNVGDSIGWLYFANTLGSSIAALLTVMILFPLLGLQGTVWVAASFNFLVGIVVIYHTCHPTILNSVNVKEKN